MIYLITDAEQGEPDFLTQCKLLDLEITDLSGAPLVTVPSPVDGWTHERLKEEAERHVAITQEADAYLGAQWIGGTEV